MEYKEKSLSVEIDIPVLWLNSNLGPKIFIFKIQTIHVESASNILNST